MTLWGCCWGEGCCALGNSTEPRTKRKTTLPVYLPAFSFSDYYYCAILFIHSTLSFYHSRDRSFLAKTLEIYPVEVKASTKTQVVRGANGVIKIPWPPMPKTDILTCPRGN